MIYLFHGEDTFSAQQALNSLYEGVGPRDLWDSNTSNIEGGDFKLDHFLGVAQVVPFLAERRLVVIRGLLGTVEQRQAPRRGRRTPRPKAMDSPTRGLAEALQNLPPTTDVAFVDGRLSRNNPLMEELKDLAESREFPVLRRDALARWVRGRMAQKGGAITNQAVAEMVEMVGGNLWAMDTELEKLATYCQDRAADPADVQSLVASARETNVFALVDAIMERRPETAMSLMEQMLQTGANGSYLLSMIGRQARLVALAQALAQESVPQAQWGGRLGIHQEFVLRKTVDQSRRFTPEQVRALYHLLLEADLAMKTGEAPEEVALVELLTRTGTMGQRR
jgi:DNA polymerase-3 subunit delta